MRKLLVLAVLAISAFATLGCGAGEVSSKDMMDSQKKIDEANAKLEGGKQPDPQSNP